MPAFSTAETAIEPNMERIVDEYATALLRVAFLYLKDTQLAEDAVQDTFLKVYRNYDQFQKGSNERTWITRICINVCKDYLRCAWKRHVITLDALPETPDEGCTIPAEDKLLVKEVMKLKPCYKEVLLLYYYQDFKINEIAQILQIPQSTVSVRLKRAREQLKKRIEGWDFD